MSVWKCPVRRQRLRTMLDTMNHGGRIAMLGIPPSDMSIDWTKVIFKGLFIKGIYGREMFETWYRDGGADSVCWPRSLADHYPSFLYR